MKLHVMGHRRNKTLPYPEIITLTDASENDLSVFKRECMPFLHGKTIFGDKIYSDLSYFNDACPYTIQQEQQRKFFRIKNTMIDMHVVM